LEKRDKLRSIQQMNEIEWVTQRFEASRSHLRAVAYRLLGSVAEADDAVQECWLRASRAETDNIENLEAWLTAITARICLNMLRSRKARREQSLTLSSIDAPAPHAFFNSEEEASLAERAGLAAMVVLQKLAPAERIAFVLHDIFGVPFEEIARIMERSPAAARQLASRARRHVRGTQTMSPNLLKQRETVEAFLRALRAGDVDGIVAVLDPTVVRRADRIAAPSQAKATLYGAERVAQEAVTHLDLAEFAQPVLINGRAGIVVAPAGRLRIAIACAFRNGKISRMDVIADPVRLRQLDLALFDLAEVGIPSAGRTKGKV
jgi:RNA polymerase sigma factor (sigma-70 family)